MNRPLRRVAVALCLFLCLVAAIAAPVAADGPSGESFRFQVRSRMADPPDGGQTRPVFKMVEWDPGRTAVVICDMWDKHWCASASARVAEMAPRVNQFVKEARRRGALVVHCPSGTMDFYKETPQRQRALAAPKVETAEPLAGWRSIIPEREGPLPIDDSDGGCDCAEPCRHHRPWTRQIAAIEIEPEDAVGDSLEVFYLMRQRGVENVLVLGVHANMCVLGRPFGIRQLVGQGMNVLLVRDLTDTMYNPAMRPHVSHFRGTDLVVAHIETHWCPTIVSTELLGGQPQRFGGDKRPHVVFLVNEDEYAAEETVPAFAETLAGRFGCSTAVVLGRAKHDLTGIEAVRSADAVVVYTRRRGLPESQMSVLREYLNSGGPLVAVRTACHGFAPRDTLPDGYATWETFDRDVLGCHYTGHLGNREGTRVTPAAGQSEHPILAGIGAEGWHSPSWLYLVEPLAPAATVLATGTAGERTQPVALTFTAGKSRVFFTSLGHRDEFRDPAFERMLVNAIHWAMDRPLPSP